MKTRRKTTQWIEFGWSGAYPIQCIPPMKAWVFDFAKIGYPLSQMALTFSRDNLSFFVHKDEYENHGKKFFDKVLKEPQGILKFLDKTNQAAEKIFGLEKSWSKIDFSKLTDKQLLHHHKIFFDVDEMLWRNGQPQNLLEMGNSFITVYLRNHLRTSFGQKKAIEIFQILSTPRYNSITERQDEDFVKLCKLANRRIAVTSVKKSLLAHWKKYQWMTYGWTGPAIPSSTFEQNFNEAAAHPSVVRELERKIGEKARAVTAQPAILKTLPPIVARAAEVLRRILECKARRTDAHSLTYFLADPLLQEIGRRLGLSLNQLRAIDPPRVRSLFKKSDTAQINKEIKFVVYWFEKGKGIKIYTNGQAEKIMAMVRKGLPKVKDAKELTGEMAFPGKVRGKVKIIERAKEIDKFRKGEILVTAMTDPGFMPAMKLAAAVVTNSGGITCHAAIISRELRVPCVIGTKIATKVFRDGDRVEVDASRGIVRKL